MQLQSGPAFWQCFVGGSFYSYRRQKKRWSVPRFIFSCRIPMFSNFAIFNSEHVKPCSRVLLAFRPVGQFSHLQNLLFTKSPGGTMATTCPLIMSDTVTGFAHFEKASTNAFLPVETLGLCCI